MKATIENFKANRDQIIETLTGLFGSDVLVSKMNILKNQVEYSELFDKSRDIESIIEEMAKDVPSRRKTSKTAEMIAEMAERHGEVYDNKKQTFVKY